MKGGSIRDNKPFPSDALSPAGGGAFLVESDVILEGGEISGNQSELAGGVCFEGALVTRLKLKRDFN